MNFRPEKSGRGLIINVTSLIDVMFLLLIFFMVTSTFRNQPAVNLVLPRSATATGSLALREEVVADGLAGKLALVETPAAAGGDQTMLPASEAAKLNSITG